MNESVNNTHLIIDENILDYGNKCKSTLLNKLSPFQDAF